jgi:DNA-binding transcriptional ArsR family regulator
MIARIALTIVQEIHARGSQLLHDFSASLQKISVFVFRFKSKYIIIVKMKIDDAFKALADSTRREILFVLRQGEMTAGALSARFDPYITKSSMSYHFAKLKEAGLVTARRDGLQIWYALYKPAFKELAAWTLDLSR